MSGWRRLAWLITPWLGFLPSYFVPMARGTFQGEPIIHVHGMIMFSWLLFFFIQTLLVARGKVLAHRTWGVLGVSIYTAMVFLTMAIVSMRIAQASLPGQPAGIAHDMRAFEWISVGAFVLGIPTFVLAIVYVKRPEIHKRLMLLVNIGLLGAPIARWFKFFLAPPVSHIAVSWPAGLPHVSTPPVFFGIPPSLVADIPLIVAIIYDWRTRGRPHPVYLWGGAAGLLFLATLVPVARGRRPRLVGGRDRLLGHLTG